jgi:hypothetical protein
MQNIKQANNYDWKNTKTKKLINFTATIKPKLACAKY